jgi:TolB-like protein
MQAWKVLFVGATLLLASARTLAAAENVYPAAILPFQERGAEVHSLGSQVTDLLFVSLVANPKIYLVDREDLDKVLKEQELNLSGLIKPSEATRVGQITGAKVLITGSVLQVDNKMYLVAKIIGTETTRVVGASVSGSVRDNLDGLVKQLAEQVAKTIEERAVDLVAKPKTREDRLATIKKALGKAKLPKVKVEIEERHVSQLTIDPAAETEITYFCKELGFEVIDPQSSRPGDADVLLIGKGFSEFATRHGNLISVKARLELKAVEERSGRILANDRQTAVVVDLTEQIAGKDALQEAAADIAERLLPKLAKHGK